MTLEATPGQAGRQTNEENLLKSGVLSTGIYSRSFLLVHSIAELCVDPNSDTSDGADEV
jgi:hypothetical protein